MHIKRIQRGMNEDSSNLKVRTWDRINNRGYQWWLLMVNHGYFLPTWNLIDSNIVH